MRLGILCAGDEELAPFLPLIRECTMQEKGKLKFYSGKILQTEVVALIRQLEQSALGEESGRQEAQKQVHRKTGSGSSPAAGSILKKEKRFAGAERFSF